MFVVVSIDRGISGFSGGLAMNWILTWFTCITGRLDGVGSLGSARYGQTRNQHYDESIPSFYPYPTGPFEAAPKVHDNSTSHQHFLSTQEIKLRDPRFGSFCPLSATLHCMPPISIAAGTAGHLLVPSTMKINGMKYATHSHVLFLTINLRSMSFAGNIL